MLWLEWMGLTGLILIIAVLLDTALDAWLDHRDARRRNQAHPWR